MKRILLMAMSFLFIGAPVFALLDDEEEGKLLIVLPFETESEDADSVNLSELLTKSLIGVFYYVPDYETDSFLEVKEMTAEEAKARKPEILILGSVGLPGEEGLYPVDIEIINVKGESTSLSYEAALGFEVFDTVDLLLEDSVQTVLSRSYQTAEITFTFQNIGSEIHTVKLNRQEAMVVSNDTTETFSVLSGYNYKIQIDGMEKEIFKDKIYLDEGESTNIIIDGYGWVKFSDIFYPRLGGSDYYATLEGERIGEDFSTNLMSGSYYDWAVWETRKGTNQIYLSNSFFLMNRDTEKVRLSPQRQKIVFFSIGTGYIESDQGDVSINGTPMNIDLGFYLKRKWQFSLHFSIPRTGDFFGSLDAAYFVWGDTSTPLSLSAKIGLMMRTDSGFTLQVPFEYRINPVNKYVFFDVKLYIAPEIDIRYADKTYYGIFAGVKFQI